MSKEISTKNKPRIIGYARVSTDEQKDFQTNLLKRFGAERVFYDHGISGKVAPFDRKGFKQAQHTLRKNDTIVVYRLDRLGRNLKSVIETIDVLKNNGIHFVSLTENIDTTSATGRAFWQFMGLMAELESGLISSRTIEGMKAAKQRGVHIGRPRKMTDAMILEAHQAIATKQKTMVQIAKDLDVSPVTLKRGLDRLCLETDPN